MALSGSIKFALGCFEAFQGSTGRGGLFRTKLGSLNRGEWRGACVCMYFCVCMCIIYIYTYMFVNVKS